ncbi:MAG: hypothetical protein JXR77_03745 [Lentisphaeria bacterium]|nr:hypothetical protein [Lentisphaeria bacterium]
MAPVEEQREIARLLNEYFSWITSAERALASALGSQESLDQATLAKAFRGELVPQDPNDLPASVLLERIQAAKEQGSNDRTARGRQRRARQEK